MEGTHEHLRLVAQTLLTPNAWVWVLQFDMFVKFVPPCPLCFCSTNTMHFPFLQSTEHARVLRTLSTIWVIAPRDVEHSLHVGVFFVCVLYGRSALSVY